MSWSIILPALVGVGWAVFVFTVWAPHVPRYRKYPLDYFACSDAQERFIGAGFMIGAILALLVGAGMNEHPAFLVLAAVVFLAKVLYIVKRWGPEEREYREWRAWRDKEYGEGQ